MRFAYLAGPHAMQCPRLHHRDLIGSCILRTPREACFKHTIHAMDTRIVWAEGSRCLPKLFDSHTKTSY